MMVVEQEGYKGVVEQEDYRMVVEEDYKVVV